MDDFLPNFLHFGQKSFHAEIEGKRKVRIFDQSGKSIALLFDQICSILGKDHNIVEMMGNERLVF